MIRRWTEKELADAMKDLVIVCDSREQINDHVLTAFDKAGVKHTTRKLNTGDYSATIGVLSMENDIVVERKHNLDEICGNFTAERERFEREFLRAKAHGTKVILIIENTTWSDVFLGNYRSKLSPKSLIGSLLSWMVRYNITILFCKPEETGKIISGIMFYAAKELLVNGRIQYEGDLKW